MSTMNLMRLLHGYMHGSMIFLITYPEIVDLLGLYYIYIYYIDILGHLVFCYLGRGELRYRGNSCMPNNPCEPMPLVTKLINFNSVAVAGL